MTFNNDIILNGNIEDIIGLQPTSGRRRILASGYTIVIIDSTTIQIIINDGGSASQYEVQILDPESIQDASGNFPSNLRSQIMVDIANIYSTSSSEGPDHIVIYMGFLAAVCIVSFLFDIEMMKFLQLLYVHYFVGLILPPELGKVLTALRWSTLQYIPTLYSVPDPVLRENIPGPVYDTLGDFSFLRNGGFALTPLAAIVLVWMVLKVLSVPEINRFKSSRMWCKELL